MSATEDSALRVQTDAMAPMILRGDELTVHPQTTAEPGQTIVVSVDGLAAVIERYDGSDGYTILGVVKSLYREFK